MAVLLFYFLYWGFGTIHIVKGNAQNFKYKKNYVIYNKNLIERAYNGAETTNKRLYSL